MSQGTMTDKELLELAAKAAGISGGWGEHIEYHNGAVDLSDTWILDQEEFCPWNPLADDGDAMRLAVDLGLRTYPCASTASGYACSAVANANNMRVGETVATGDRRADTRRAIVRAAAEIGRAISEAQ